MSPTAAERLLADVEPLAHPHRMRALALHARRIAGTPELDALLAELSGPLPYRRHVALHMAMAARDLEYVADVLAGPDMDLRKAALRAVRTLPVPDDAVARALDDAPTDLRRSVYRTLLHARRTALADRLLPDVRARYGDRDAAMLLPACSSETVDRLLPDLAHVVTMWRVLAARHPDAFLGLAERELSEDGGTPWRFLNRRGPGIVAAAEARPDEARDVFVRTGLLRHAGRLPAQALNALYRRDPAGFAELLAGQRSLRPARSVFRPRLWSDDEVAGRLMRGPFGNASMLADLPPHRRDRVFRLALGERDGTAPAWTVMPMLPWLSPDTAAGEARRLLDGHASARQSSREYLDDPDDLLRLTSFLPYGEAAETLVEASLGGDPRRRGLARTLLLANAARTGDPAAVAGHLAAIARRVRNEPDPLRAELFDAVAALSPRVLSDACAEPLGVLTTAVIESRDTSPETMRAVRRLAVRVLRHRADLALTAWATGALAGLLGRFGAGALRPAPDTERPRHHRRRGSRRWIPDDHRLDRVVPRGGEAAVLEAFAPHLRASRERGDHEVLVAVAASFGRRPTGLDGDLREAVLHAPEDVGGEAARLYLARDPGRAAELLAEDPATIALPGVWRAVANRRTDVLTLDRDPGNRFGPWIPDLKDARPGHWTPAQLRAAGISLDAAARDEAFDVADRMRAIASLGRLPHHLPDLSTWVRDSEGAMAEAAIEAAAGHLDALPMLLEMARGPASAVAVAGLARCAGRVRPSVLGPALGAALTSGDTKVTVRKQAARLLGRHRPPGALDALLRAWRDPARHRDVRVAVAVALRSLPDDPRALEALAEAPRDHPSEELLRALFEAAPAEYALDTRPAMATLIKACLNASGDMPGVLFRGSKAFAVWARWYPGGHAETLAAVADPDDPAGDTEVMVLASLVRVGAVRDEILDVLARLAPEPGARRRLKSLAESLQNLALTSADEDWTEPLLREAAGVLARYPLHTETAAGFHVALLNADRETDADLVTGLTALAHLLRDRPVLAQKVYQQLSLGGHYGQRAVTREALPAVHALLEGGHTAAHLLALRLVYRGGSDAGWPDEWLDPLTRLRESPFADVAEPAWDIDPDEK
ncbi:HEAT repeat domain-containing protein [Spirillospora sp. NPDC052269]